MEEVTLRVEVPGVEVRPIETEVVCGKSRVKVYEYGVRGSGDWAAWLASGYTVGEGGKRGYTYEQALDDARVEAVRIERRRLLNEELLLKLDNEKENA